MNKQKIAKELMLIAREIKALQEINEDLPLQQQVKLLKDVKETKKFFKDLVKFKGSLNDFINFISSVTTNPKTLKQFPELIELALLSRFFKEHNLMKLIKMDDKTLQEKLLKVYQSQ